MKRQAVRISFASLVALLGGCGNLSYYLQSANGQLEILARARPIGEVLADPGTPADLKGRLESAQAAREFASRELALPDNRSYRNYADLARPFVVWNVFAAPELSTKLHEWCFPVAGCVTYRGYFAKEDAEAYAVVLRGEGYEAFVSGVPAYSTLGWFSDPVLSTFIRYPEAEVARLMFHELAHQMVYLPGDTEFNESFATVVEIEGMRRWLNAAGNPESRAGYAEMQARKSQFVALVLEYRGRLDRVYAAPVSDAEKRLRKRETLAALQQEYAGLKQSWGGYAGYDRWFAQDLGNAHLGSVAAYTQLVPAFQALLAEEGGDLPRFYDSVRRVSRLSGDERAARLAELAARRPPQAANARIPPAGS
ncbi:MAG TPA: aminopeptidase [Burkholderiales bacterium]|nr:aminopeptidase [Burkholderiales bacterium]